MKKILLVCFVFASSICNGQSLKDSNAVAQRKIIESAINYFKETKRLDSLQKVIESGKITYPKFISSAYIFKANALAKKYTNEIRDYKNGDTLKRKYVNEVLGNYQLAIDTCVPCRLHYLNERLYFLHNINDTAGLYKENLKELKMYGYHEQTISLSLGVNYSRGINNWLGGELSLLTSHDHEFRRTKKDTSISKKYHIPSSSQLVGNFLTISYMQNLDKKGEDFSFSLFYFSAPIYFNVTKFGYQRVDDIDKNIWYYRPEFGFGYKYFSIYYSYNLIMRSTESKMEKHMLNLKVLLPLNKKAY